MLALILGWSVVMAAIILVVNRQWKGGAARNAEWAPDRENKVMAEEHEFINEHAAACQAIMGQVLSFAAPEQISPFVFNSRKTFSDMVRFHGMNPGTQILEVPMRPQRFTVLHLPEGPAIEGRWIAEDGRLVDAVFRKEDGEWRLDWHHFARFSEYPWGLFLAGDGPEQAEFRLLARQRVLRADADQRPPYMSVFFHVPRFARPDEPGPPSPLFELEWDSAAARMLMAGFHQTREGRQPFLSRLPSLEAEHDMIRVRVVVRRIEDDDGRRFEIVEVRACHWIQHDDPGISVDGTD